MSKSTKKMIIFVIAALAEIFLIGFIPAETTAMTRGAWQYLGIFLAMLTLVASNALPGFAVVLFCLSFIALFNIAPFAAVFAQFSSTTMWLIISIYLLCIGLGNSGIMQRVALTILKRFPKNYKGATLSMLTTSLVLAPFLPSTTAKVGILTPLATEITKSYGFEKHSKEAIGIWTAAFVPAWFWGYAFISGSANVPIFLGFIGDAASFTWGSWFLACIPWLIVSIVSVFIFTVYMCAPKHTAAAETAADNNFIQNKLDAMGPMSLKEKQAAGIMTAGIALWVTQSIHGINATIVGILIVVAMVACGLINPMEFSAKGNWSLIVYIAGVLAVAGFMSTTGLGNVIGGMLSGVVAPIAQNPYIFVPCLVLLTYALRFIVPDPFTLLAIFIGVFTPILPQYGINMALVVIICGLSGNIWCFGYQQGLFVGLIGMAGGEYVTFRDSQKANYLYLLFNLIGLTVSVPLWQMLGYC